MNYIIEKSNNNRLKLNNELNKILNFYKKKSHISFNDIVKLVNSNQRFDISDFIDQLLLKNEKKVIKKVLERHELRQRVNQLTGEPV